MLVWQMIPTLEVGMFFFLTHEVKLSSVTVSNMEFVVKLGTLAGLWIFDYLFSKLSMNKLFPRIALLSAVLCLPSLLFSTRLNTFFAIDDHTFALIEKICRLNSATFIYRSALLLSAEICNSNDEPGFYSVLMAVMNIGEGLQQTLVSFLLSTLAITETQFSNLWLYVSIVIATIFVPVLIMGPLIGELLRANAKIEASKGSKKKKTTTTTEEALTKKKKAQ